MRSFMRLSLAVFLVLGLDTFANAQDPFGEPDGGDPFGTATGDDPFNAAPGNGSGFGGFGAAPAAGTSAPADAAAPSQGLDLNDPDPLVRIVRSNPPESPSELADAITWMTRIKRWDEVGRLLTDLSTKNWTQTQLAELSRSAGSAMWIRLRGMDDVLSGEQLQTVAQILEAPAKIASSPGWLDGWIAKLASNSPGERQLAQLRLQDGNRAAIKRLVDNLVGGSSSVDAKTLVQTLRLFGQDGVDALRAACSIPEPSKAHRVILGLAEFPKSGFSAELGAALHSTKYSQEQRDALKKSLATIYDRVPKANAVSEYLSAKYENALGDYQAARLSGKDIQDWNWAPSADGQSIQAVQSTVANRKLSKLARLAQLRLQLGDMPASQRASCVASVLQHAYQANSGLNDTVDAQALFGSAASLNTQDLEEVFDAATDMDFHGAALRALQLAASVNLPSVTFFSNLLTDSRPIIRYSALAELSKLDPKEPYGGEGAAVRTALEMNHLGSGPHALIVGLRSELLQVAQQQIQQFTAADVTVANSAQAALLELNSGDPVELIFVVDRVNDQSLFELIQRLRNSKRGHAVPIAVLTDQLYAHERSLISTQGGVLSSVMSRDPSQMKRILQKMYLELDTEPMTAEDRSALALEAGRFITTISSQPEQYPFYQLGQLHTQIVASAANLDQASEVKVLAGMSTKASQEQLLKKAINSRLGTEIVNQAANGFSESVKRNGMLLGRITVENAYDDYNRLAPNDPTVARALGHILDVMEANAGQATWPKPLR